MPPIIATHDIIVIGASAGGVEALKRLAEQFPSDLPAAVLVVLHISPDSPSLLSRILDRAGPLRASGAVDGEAIRPGHIYCAQPDHHLLVHRGHLGVVRGPRENRSRPAIDPLFRTAAASYGPRVIGVVLTGYLDDGTAGLIAIKQCGGLAVVQDPQDTMYPQMPRSAVENVDVDHVVPLAEMGALLSHLAREPAGDSKPVPPDVRLEAEIAETTMSSPSKNDQLGKPSQFSCPECGGTLWELRNESVQRYRCHLGHAYTAQALLADQNEATERAVWAALRLMEERARILRTLADDERNAGHTRTAAIYHQRCHEWHEHGERLRDLLTRSREATESESPAQQ